MSQKTGIALQSNSGNDGFPKSVIKSLEESHLDQDSHLALAITEFEA